MKPAVIMATATMFLPSPFVATSSNNEWRSRFSLPTSLPYFASAPFTGSISKNQISDVMKQKFARHFQKWQGETGLQSMTYLRFGHKDYQSILAMGKSALPMIFEQLKSKPAHLTVALSVLTGENPVRPNATFKQSIEDWIAWGEANGYA